MNEFSVRWLQTNSLGPIVFATPLDAQGWAETAAGDTSARFGANLTYEVIQRTKETVYSDWETWVAPEPTEPPVEELV